MQISREQYALAINATNIARTPLLASSPGPHRVTAMDDKTEKGTILPS